MFSGWCLSETRSSAVTEEVIHKLFLIVAQYGMEICLEYSSVLRLRLWFLLCGSWCPASCWAQCCKQLPSRPETQLGPCLRVHIAGKVTCHMWARVLWRSESWCSSYWVKPLSSCVIPQLEMPWFSRITGKWNSTKECWCSCVAEITAGVKNQDRQIY